MLRIGADAEKLVSDTFREMGLTKDANLSMLASKRHTRAALALEERAAQLEAPEQTCAWFVEGDMVQTCGFDYRGLDIEKEHGDWDFCPYCSKKIELIRINEDDTSEVIERKRKPAAELRGWGVMRPDGTLRPVFASVGGIPDQRGADLWCASSFGCGDIAVPVRLTTEDAADATVDEARDALRLIAAERIRQIESKGWTPAHDDTHRGDELARAAAVFALPDRFREPERQVVRAENGGRDLTWMVPKLWPWKGESDHCGVDPTDRLTELVKAGALIVAEIERLQRATEGAR